MSRRANCLWLPRTEDPLPEAARVYAENGWPIFPCRGKHPYESGGFHTASTDLAQVATWWQRWPQANIGWNPPHDWFVVDEDARHGGEITRRALEKKHEPLPFTLRAVTGNGGPHWILKRPPGVEVRQGAHVAGPGLDTRVGGRGYILLAPSIHPITRLPYRWHSVVEPAVAPDWLVDLIRVYDSPTVKAEYTPPKKGTTEASARETYARTELGRVATDVANASDGSRNDALNKAWWRILKFRDVVSESEAKRELTRAAESCGLKLKEIAQVLR